MASFGQRMKREREMRGIKLDEISESTKIARRNLEALEQEQFDRLPGGIFNKGFVRAYAKYLGLDEEQAVNDFMLASANYDQPAALQPPPTSWVKPPVIPSDAALRRKNLIWAIAAAIILIFGLAAWFYFLRYGQTNPRTQLVPQSFSPRSDALPVSLNTALQQPAAQPVLVLRKFHRNQKTEPKDANALSTGISLSLHAKQDSWVSVTADGQLLLDTVLAAGSERTVYAKKALALKTGNAGGLEISRNGKLLPPLGKEKQVKTLTIYAAK